MKDNIKFDDFGNIDADYYVEQAYELRREFYAAQTKKIVASVKTFFANFSLAHPFKAFQH